MLILVFSMNTCHTTNKKLFLRKIIFRSGDLTWPPKSPNFTVVELWVYLKTRSKRIPHLS